MELKRFRNKYDLELIPASHENIILGNLVWDPLIGKPRFSYPGMSEHIYNSFLDAGIISKENWMKGIKDLSREKIKMAHLADRIISVEANVIGTLENPQIVALENEFDLKKASKFHFGNLQVRTMSNLNRIKIDNYLEILKRDNWQTYDGRLRRVFMITELYYGNIQLILDKEIANGLNINLKNIDLNLIERLEFDKSVEYSFDHQKVPFAMRLEKLRMFNA